MKTTLATLFLALASLSATSCGPYSQEAAVVGGLLGAGAGAIIGHQSGRGLEGAAIGGALGAGAGALIGDAQDQRHYGSSYHRGGSYRRDYYPGHGHYYDACPPPRRGYYHY